MNKKGSIYFSLTIALIIFVMGVLFLPFLTDDITTARVALDCSNSSISDGTKITCLETDALVPYFIWLFASISIGYLIGRDKWTKNCSQS